MKPDIHPEYRQVLFRDISCDFEFVTGSCVQSEETAEYNGEEYPLVIIDISSESHPFYTGTQKLLDSAGRVEKFYKKYGFQRAPEHEQQAEEPAAEEPAADAEA